MPRKNKGTSTERYNKAFPRMLRRLMDEQGVTQQELGAMLGKTRQAVGSYADGSSSPDWETIVSIATYFQVSTDFMLGMQSLPLRDDSVIYDELGLSLPVMNRLRSMNEGARGPYYEDFMDLIAAIILGSEFPGHAYRDYKNALYDFSNKENKLSEFAERMAAIEMDEQEFLDLLQSTLKETEFKLLFSLMDSITKGTARSLT